MVEIGHGLLTFGELRPWGVEVQIDDDRDVVARQQVDVRRNGVLVLDAAVGAQHAIDAQPAVLVEDDAHGLNIPGLHRGDFGLIGRTFEDARI